VVPHLDAMDAAWTAGVTMGEGPRIGVGPFVDRRSDLSRAPQWPTVRPAWVGVMWVGERSTGERSFHGDIAEGARADVAATLRYTGLFRSVSMVDAYEPPPDVDYLLTGEVEELLGLQYTKVELNLLSAGLIVTRADTPIGTARVRFRLVSAAGEEVWRAPLETRLEVGRTSLKQAALDALAVTHQRLVVELGQRLVGPRIRPLRSVALRVLDACGLGDKLARRLIEDTSEIFELELGVELLPIVETWVPPDGAGSAEDLLTAAEGRDPPQAGLVVALAPFHEGLGRPGGRSGLARQLGRHAVVACAPVTPRAATIAHELGHLFGAVHVRDRGSVMYPVADFDARFFDPLNRRILAAARDRRFERPVAADLRRALRTLYDEAAGLPAHVELADLEAAAGAL
jgi:hypothetical protein